MFVHPWRSNVISQSAEKFSALLRLLLVKMVLAILAMDALLVDLNKPLASRII